MATNYSLTVKNEGTETGDFCIYQTDDNQTENIRSLVWFSKRAHPHTELKFEWNIDYGFSWSETGTLVPGMVFEAQEVKPIDLAIPAETASALSADGDRLCYKQTEKTVSAGEIGLLTDETVPEKSYSIGVLMSGAPVFAVEATPNYNFSFKPDPQYHIALGQFDVGEVLDMDKLAGAISLDLSEQTPNCTVTLRPDGTIK